MKMNFVIVGCALVVMTDAAMAQYSIAWSKIAGGGATSTGGAFTASGTIGQHDAGAPMSGGSFSLVGGFWAWPQAVQMEGAPTLTIISASPGAVRISWAPGSPGFVLQESAGLAPLQWVNAPSGMTNPIVVPMTLPTKFYRLFKP